MGWLRLISGNIGLITSNIPREKRAVSCAVPDPAIRPSSLTAYCVSLAEGIVEDEVPLSVVDDRRHVGTTAQVSVTLDNALGLAPRSDRICP